MLPLSAVHGPRSNRSNPDEPNSGPISLGKYSTQSSYMERLGQALSGGQRLDWPGCKALNGSFVTRSWQGLAPGRLRS